MTRVVAEELQRASRVEIGRWSLGKLMKGEHVWLGFVPYGGELGGPSA